MKSTRFQLAGGDHNVGTVYLPGRRPGPLPVLVVCFGGASDREPYAFTRELCARLTGAGMAVVTFDFYAWGESPGDPHQWSYGRWAGNLAEVCGYVAGQEWSAERRIGALGISAGSTAVLRCAIETDGLAAGISVATYLGHFTAMPDGPVRLLVDRLETLAAGGRVESEAFGLVGLDFFRDAVGGAPVYRLDRIACPFLFLQGSADNPYRRSDAWLGYQLLRACNPSVTYREIEGGDHTLENVAAEAAEIVLAWLRQIGFV